MGSVRVKPQEKRRYVMSNLVYGQLYPQLWLENQLKSLCDPSNLPALKGKYDLEYAVFTDEQTLQEQLTKHPNWMRLSQFCDIKVVRLHWPSDADAFGSRYHLLVQMFHEVLKVALQTNTYAMSLWVADLVFAKGSLPKMLSHIERGHDAVFNVPIRSAADGANAALTNLPGAPSDLELFEIAYRNLHHLWVASHWDAPLFSRMPYSMLWNSGTGLCAHNFGITPIVFRPDQALTQVSGVIDADVPSYFKNPYWAHDWTDAAVAGVEPLSNGHYPPFAIHKANAEWVADWSKKGTQPCQATNLDKPLFYPSRKQFNDDALAERALDIAQLIQRNISAP